VSIGPWKTFLGSLAAFVLLVGGLSLAGSRERSDSPSLLVYCAASMAGAMAELAREYEQQHGTRIQLQLGGSGTLLSSVILSQQGDLFLPADATYVQRAAEKGLVQESTPLLQMTPTLVVQEGNPKHVTRPADLVQSSLRVSLASPEAASIGQVGKALLSDMNLWQAVEANVIGNGVFKPSVNDVVNDVKLGAADAGLVWDAVAAAHDDLESVPLSHAARYAQVSPIALLVSSGQPERARDFIAYLSHPEKGMRIFRKHHFTPAPSVP